MGKIYLVDRISIDASELVRIYYSAKGLRHLLFVFL